MPQAFSQPELVLENKAQQDESPVLPGIMVTPVLDDDYWMFRVRLSDTQAILGFPKFGTIGIGFAQEEDWNTNLPYTCDAEEIFQHVRHNKGDESISDNACRVAIRMVQTAAKASRAVQDGGTR